MVNGGGELALGRSWGGLEIGKDMAGVGHGQLWPKCGEFFTNVGGRKMLNCRGICAAKRRDSRASRVAGADSGAKWIIDDPDGGPECTSERPT